jgi:hypothetical protein
LWVDTFHYQVNLPLAIDRPQGPPYSRYLLRPILLVV